MILFDLGRRIIASTRPEVEGEAMLNDVVFDSCDQGQLAVDEVVGINMTARHVIIIEDLNELAVNELAQHLIPIF